RRAVHDDLLEARERAAADEQDVRGIDLQELLLRVLASALRRYRGDRALDQLQKRLLHALARDVTRDRRVARLARDLVDLVDVDDARLRLLDVVVALLQQLLDDVLDVLADVARLRQRGGVRNRERHVQQARERLREQRLAAARRANQQDVALRKLRVVLAAIAVPVLQPLVVVVDGDGQDLLRPVLADDVLVQHRLDLVRLRQLAPPRLGRVLELFTDDVVAELDALVADEDRRPRDQLANFVLALAAKRTIEELAILVLAAGIIAHTGVASVSLKKASGSKFI